MTHHVKRKRSLTTIVCAGVVCFKLLTRRTKYGQINTLKDTKNTTCGIDSNHLFTLVQPYYCTPSRANIGL